MGLFQAMVELLDLSPIAIIPFFSIVPILLILFRFGLIRFLVSDSHDDGCHDPNVYLSHAGRLSNDCHGEWYPSGNSNSYPHIDGSHGTGGDPDISDSHTIPDNHGYVADAPLQNGHID